MSGVYLDRISLALSLGIIDTRTATKIDCYHDKECGVYRDKPCDCNPTIAIRTCNSGTVYLGSDGQIQQMVQKRRR